MSVGYDQVEPTVIIHVKEGDSPTNGNKAGPRKSGGCRDVCKTFFALIPEQGVGFLGEVGYRDIQASIAVKVAEIYTHSRALLAFKTECSASLQCNFFESAVVFIVVEIVRAAIVGDIEVRPAIVVVVRPEPLHAEVMAGITYPSFQGYIFKSAVTAVAKQEIRFAGVAPARTFHSDAAEVTQLTVVLSELVDIYLKIAWHE